MNWFKYIKLFLFLTMILLLSCEKEIIQSSDTAEPEIVRVYNDEKIKIALGSVAGDGVVLLIYVNTDDHYLFKLIDNNGVELWTRDLGYKYEGPITELNSYLNVIYDVDGTFAIFHKSSLIKINVNGDIVKDEPDFAPALSNNSILNVKLGIDGVYLFLGNYPRNNGGSLLKVISINPDGTVVFNFGIQNPLNTLSTFVDAAVVSDDEYLFMGTKNYLDQSDRSSVIRFFLSKNGLPRSSTTSTFEYSTRKGSHLIRKNDSNFIFIRSPYNSESLNQKTNVWNLSEKFDSIITRFDFDPVNVISGTTPYLCDGIVKNANGTFTGLMKSTHYNSSEDDFTIPGNFSAPHFTYLFTLDENGKLIKREYLNITFSNYINSISKLSDDRNLLFGSTYSFGEELKLMILIK